jgi:cathepsin X
VFNASSPECESGEALCHTCSIDFQTLQTTCTAVHVYPRVGVSKFGQVEEELEVMDEVFAHGPVACHINALCLEGGAQIDDNGVFGYKCDGHNHVVQLAGWGEARDGTRFWILRNSWGTAWADHGWFRIRRDPPNNWSPSTFGCNWVHPYVAEPARLV